MSLKKKKLFFLISQYLVNTKNIGQRKFISKFTTNLPLTEEAYANFLELVSLLSRTLVKEPNCPFFPLFFFFFLTLPYRNFPCIYGFLLDSYFFF